MTETFEPGELFIYEKAPGVYELGVTKRQRDDHTWFCYYSTGDTAAATPIANMRKLTNAKWAPIRWADIWGGDPVTVANLLKLIPGGHEVFVTDGDESGMFCRAVGVPDAFMGLRVVGITAVEGCIDIEVYDG